MPDERIIPNPTDLDTDPDPRGAASDDRATDAPADQAADTDPGRGACWPLDRRRRRRHRGHHGRGPAGRRGHRVDWDDPDALERYQRHLEQREADIQAKITRVRDRINDLTRPS